MVRKVEEKFGGTYHADSSREALEEIIEQNNLIDIPPNNRKYSWSNKRVGKNNIKERLDRILLQETIAADYTSVKSKIIHTTTSEHKPLAIMLGKMDNQGPLPFRYNSI